MVRMLVRDSKQYPKLRHYIEHELPKVKSNIRVWEAFKKNANISQSVAENTLRFDHDDAPLLRIAQLDNVKKGVYINGRFRSADPDWIVLDATIASRFQSDYQLDKAQQLVQSTVLHEMVHWGECRTGDGYLSNSPEYGKKFENEAYGHDVSRYWTEPERTPARIGLDDADFGQISNLEAYSMDSTIFKEFIPRGIRNNNPGNIRINPNNLWEGAAVVPRRLEVHRNENTFEVFLSPMWGIRAIAKTIDTYATKYNCKSVSDIINRWAPESDNNNPQRYSIFVANLLNVSINKPVKLRNKVVLSGIITGIISFENGRQPYTDEVIDKGLSMAGYS